MEREVEGGGEMDKVAVNVFVLVAVLVSFPVMKVLK